MSPLSGMLRISRFDINTRLLITIIVFIVALLITMVGLLAVNVDFSEAQRRESELQKEFERFNDPRAILGNNLIHTLIMFVPIWGPIWGGFVLFNTGTTIGILATAYEVPSILIFLTLFLTPVFWLEFCAYSIAMAESVVLLLQITRGHGRLEAVRMCILVTGCALTLLLSAVVEWAMINLL